MGGRPSVLSDGRRAAGSGDPGLCPAGGLRQRVEARLGRGQERLREVCAPPSSFSLCLLFMSNFSNSILRTYV